MESVTNMAASIHNPHRHTPEDDDDIALAHRYRLSLPSKPTQSSFRVLALLFYTVPSNNTERNKNLPALAPWLAHTTLDGRAYVVGTNDEPGFIGGAICAERSAMVQLRFVPNFELSKVVIATDSSDPITPGVLCREFLAGHASVPWDLPVVTAGCSCTKCDKKDGELFPTDGKTAACCEENGNTHCIPTIHTTIRQLYPYPSPYARLTATESVALGEAYSSRAVQDLDTLDEPDSKRLLELATMEASSHVSDLHPIQFGAAVIFDDGSIVTSHQASALEYGCTLDAVSQLAPHFQEDATPLLVVQADQYGIAHAPFAPARAFLTEQGFGHCQIVVHDVSASNPTDAVLDIMEKWTLKEVFVSDLAPSAPSWTEGTDREEEASGNQ